MTSLVGEFAKNVRVDHRADIEFGLLSDLTNSFGSNPVVARRAMRELLMHSPGGFYSAALNILKSGNDGPGFDYLIGLLLENNLLTYALGDPEAFPVDVAITLAKSLSRVDPQLDAKLMRQILKDDGTFTEGANVDRLERVLAVVDEISDGTRLVTSLMKLVRHPNPRVCSKASLMVVRAHRNADWFAQQMSNPDPRVRANTVEGLLYARPNEKELAGLWQYSRDPHHRVATTALLVLYKNGKEEAGDLLEQLATHSSEYFRAAAAWAMGQTLDPRFLALVQGMVRSDQGLAKRAALKASVLIRKEALAAQESRPKPAACAPEPSASQEPHRDEMTVT
ncbi:MAG: HEAT repeat domain-containing protein [Bryobacterales bacterium]|nr:HEAT repeat domain-containing protein [Bryobacterales bacterium]